MDHYQVTWMIDVWADDEKAAAEQARAHQTREGTTAVVFNCYNTKTKVATMVDLLEKPLNAERKV